MKLFFFGLIVFLVIHESYSQFDGGNGNGYFGNVISNSDLSGNSVQFIYLGGTENGYTSNSIKSINLSSDDLTLVFNGGQGRGDVSANNIIISLNGDDLNVLFPGGIGRGDALFTQLDLELDGMLQPVPYLGGNASGFEQALLAYVDLNSEDLSHPFTGGDRSGFDSQGIVATSLLNQDLGVHFIAGNGRGDVETRILHQSLNSDDLGFPFSGNPGRGDFSQSNVAIAANGLNLSIIYSGGDGKGDQASDILLNALPIELISFFGTPEKEHILLQWQTGSEINNDFFTLEKSITTDDWIILEEVDGSGNSTEIKDYETVDFNPILGVQYYRLKQTDFNGSSEYSRIISVLYEQKGAVFVYPNPTTGQLGIGFKGVPVNNYEIKILDINGRVVWEKTNLTYGNFQHDISTLNSNIYFVEVKINGTKSVLKIIKE